MDLDLIACLGMLALLFTRTYSETSRKEWMAMKGLTHLILHAPAHFG